MANDEVTKFIAANATIKALADLEAEAEYVRILWARVMFCGSHRQAATDRTQGALDSACPTCFAELQAENATLQAENATLKARVERLVKWMDSFDDEMRKSLNLMELLARKGLSKGIHKMYPLPDEDESFREDS